MERFRRTYKREFFLHRKPRFLDEAKEMTARWLESAPTLKIAPKMD